MREYGFLLTCILLHKRFCPYTGEYGKPVLSHILCSVFYDNFILYLQNPKKKTPGDAIRKSGDIVILH